jgi:CRP-like cAMP-binding protein
MMNNQFPLLRKNIEQKLTLSDEQFDLFCSKIKVTHVKRKQQILRPGEVCIHSSFINKGAVRGFVVNDKFEEKTILLGMEDWWAVDFYSYITGKPSLWTLEAVEDCELLQMTFADLESIFDRAPSIERFVRLMAMNAYVAAQERLMNLMTNAADRRYETLLAKYPQMLQRFPQYMVASYLNLTPEHLSVAKSKLFRSK